MEDLCSDDESSNFLVELCQILGVGPIAAASCTSGS